MYLHTVVCHHQMIGPIRVLRYPVLEDDFGANSTIGHNMAHLVASSPLSSPPPTQSFNKPSSSIPETSSHRPSRELPFELAQHIQTYYEEQLFTQAYGFLLSITSNSSSSLNRAAPVTIPPPSHLALAATIAVHPVFTTRTHSREKWDQANAALRLLRLVHKTVGPVNADFATAFSFRKYDFRSSRHGGGVRVDDEDGDVSGNDEIGEHDLNTPYAGLQGLWAGAEDFWQLIGWAFNCACLPGIHAARWNHYRLLLEFLVDVLEADWHIRNTGPSPSPEESLMWQYIELAAGGHARARRIVRAIFADGTTRSTSEFRAIFAHELKEAVVHDGKIKKREVDVDIDQEIYGDYMAQDDSDLSDDADVASTGTGASGRPSKRLRTRTRTPSSRVTPRSSTGSLRSDYENDGDAGAAASSATALGDPVCVNLRLRLLRLLTFISSHPTLTSTSPTTFPDMEDLFTLFVEFIKPLPLPVFAQIILTAPAPAAPPPSNAPPHTHSSSGYGTNTYSSSGRAPANQSQVFDPQTQTLLCESLLQRLLENSAPAIRSNVLLSQSKLEEEYLPYAAGRNSVDANARVSLLLEALTRNLGHLGGGVLKKTDALVKAVARGTERRMSKVAELGDAKRSSRKGGGAGGKTTQGGEAWVWLVESGERLVRIVNGLGDDT